MSFQEQIILLQSFKRMRTTELNDGLHYDPTLPRPSWHPKISPYRFMVFSIPLCIGTAKPILAQRLSLCSLFLLGMRHAETRIRPNTFYGCSNRTVSTLYGICHWAKGCRSSAPNIYQMNVISSSTQGPSSPRTASLSQLL